MAVSHDNYKLRLLVFGLAWVIWSFACSFTWADFKDGASAYRRGDYESALREFKPLAEQGDPSAQFNLGLMYLKGHGVKMDGTQAVVWLRMSALQGLDVAEYSLGQSYYFGWGLAKDDQQAAHWILKAADQGLASAQHDVGLLYDRGEGVPRNSQQAYFWWLLASARGNQSAIKARDSIERELSATQRAEAQSAASKWQPIGARATPRPSPSTSQVPNVPAMVSTGSGFAVTRTQVVSNAHVVEGCARVTLGGRGEATVQTVDARSDLALLTVASRQSLASLRAGRVRQGDSVSVVGYPLRGLLASGAQVASGNISALAGMQNDSRFIQISAPVQPGNSGGPLVDSSGNVVGVVVSKLNAVKMAQITGDIPQNVNFAVSPLVLQGFLDANGVDYQTAPSNKNLSTADVADIAKKYTVLVECWR